jgi:integrase
MAPRKRKSRVYWRDQGGARRAWFDGRDYGEVGGKLEPLVARGERFATTDSDVATRLAGERLAELENARRRHAFHGNTAAPALADFARLHLIAKKRAGAVTDSWLDATQQFLERAVAYFGAERELDTIRVSDVRRWAAHLATTPARKPRKEGDLPARVMTSATIRHHLNALSNLYRRAMEDEVVSPGYNPVAALMEKPRRTEQEARWLEVPDAALLLAAAAKLPAMETPAGLSIGAELAYPLLATFLLTGGRSAEVFGLELDDVSFDRNVITFRPNPWRRLKTRTSHRVVPLWSQLSEILQPYVFGRRLERGGRLLFPAFVDGEEQMLTDVRKLLDRLAERAGWTRGVIRTRLFRHTYCAARLQTLDAGAPVSIYTVARELGHHSDEMVRRVYAHLGSTRHRSAVVEYRVAQHLEKLGDRLRRLGFVTGNVTGGEARLETETPADTEVSAGEDLPEWARRDSNARPLAPEASALSN